MESWMPFFVIVAAVAIVLQTVLLAAMFFQVRRQGRRFEQIAEEFRSRATPILARVQMLVEDAHEFSATVATEADDADG